MALRARQRPGSRALQVRPKLRELRRVQLLDLSPSLRCELDAQNLAEVHDRLAQALLPWAKSS